MRAPARAHYSLTFAILMACGLAAAVVQSLVIPALRTIQMDYGTTTSAATWVLTANLLSSSVVTPIAGRLGDMFGKKRVLVIVLTVLAVGTLVAALAPTISILIVGRLIQGVSGAIFPLSFGIIRDEFPVARRAFGIALVSAIVGVGSALGIVLAGPIVEHLSVHWLFWPLLILVIPGAIATWLLVPESPVRNPGRINWLGAALLSGWLVALLVGVTQTSSWGWTDSRTLGLFILAAVLASAWIAVEWRAAEPLVDMRMMRIRGVWTTNLATFLIGMGMFSGFVLIPQLVETPSSLGYGFDGSVFKAGLYMLPNALMMLVAGVVAGRLAPVIGSRILLILGAGLLTAAFLFLALAHAQPWQIIVGSAAAGAGIGLAFAAMSNLIVEAVPVSQTSVAAGMNSIMRSIGGAIGAQGVAAILAGAVVATGLPEERGFTIAFLGVALSLAAGTLAAMLVPKRRTPWGIEVVSPSRPLDSLPDAPQHATAHPRVSTSG